jgi:cytochrome c556
MRELIRLGSLTLMAICLVLVPKLGLAQDVIEKRQKLMESNLEALKAIRVAEKEKDYKTIQIKAKEITENMARVPDLFPKGSVSEKSDAHPAIWERWDEFRKDAAKTKTEAQALLKAAEAKDDAEVKAKVKSIGGMTSGACGECHLSFNQKRMKK